MKYLLPLLLMSCTITPDVYILPEACEHSVSYNEEAQRIEVIVVSELQYATICYQRPGYEPFCKVSERAYFNCISLNATNVEGVEVRITTDQECKYVL